MLRFKFICFEATSPTSVYKRPQICVIIAAESRHRLRSAVNDARQPIVHVVSWFSLRALSWFDETIQGAFLLHLHQFTSLYREGQNFGVFSARARVDG